MIGHRKGWLRGVATRSGMARYFSNPHARNHTNARPLDREHARSGLVGACVHHPGPVSAGSEEVSKRGPARLFVGYKSDLLVVSPFGI
jgi:hypothetical protein